MLLTLNIILHPFAAKREVGNYTIVEAMLNGEIVLL